MEIELFFDAVRADDVATVRAMLAEQPELAKLRWLARGNKDAQMRSLGPRPFNQHSWSPCPVDFGSNDPRFTSTPLTYTRNDEIVKLLADAGDDVNAKATCGILELPDWFYTPLWRAAHDGRLSSVKLLVERGADMNYATPDGANQALNTGAENDQLHVCNYLLERGACPDLITAAMLGLFAEVEFNLRRDPQSIQLRESHGRSALDAATLLDSFRVCRRGLNADHDRVAHLLIEHGATAGLEHAASLGRLDWVEQIVARDPEIVTRPKNLAALLGGAATPESALHAARRRGHTQVAEYLVARGAVEKPNVIIA